MSFCSCTIQRLTGEKLDEYTVFEDVEGLQNSSNFIHNLIREEISKGKQSFIPSL